MTNENKHFLEVTRKQSDQNDPITVHLTIQQIQHTDCLSFVNEQCSHSFHYFKD